MTVPQAEHTHIATNGVRLHVTKAGPQDGPLAILLHGFPEFWYGWRHQIPALAAAGFQVWSPDQRGYNRSDKPAGTEAYRIDTLAADIGGLIDASGRQQVCLVGHDWGAVVAWWIALTAPERLDRLVILNGPHPAVMRSRLTRSIRQLLRSWYIFGFQLPWLPEWLLRRGDWRLLARGLRKTSRPGTFTDEDLELYRQAWSEPGAITAMLNWYRALLRCRPQPVSDLRVAVPTLVIWGAGDRFLGREMAAQSVAYCESGRLTVIEEATHWIQHERPDQVNELIAGFCGSAVEPQ